MKEKRSNWKKIQVYKISLVKSDSWDDNFGNLESSIALGAKHNHVIQYN